MTQLYYRIIFVEFFSAQRKILKTMTSIELINSIKTSENKFQHPSNKWVANRVKKILDDATSKSKILQKVPGRTNSEISTPGCSNCVKIPFSLGNGLPATDPNAIPNSDGTFGSFDITVSGNYVLQNSPQMQISGAGIFSPNTAINILVSDVYLDLCHQVLTGSGNLTAPFSPSPSPSGGITNDNRVDASFGISVNPNGFPFLDNVTIVNGKLQYYSVQAMQAVNVNNFTVKDLLIENNGSVTYPFGNINIFVFGGSNFVHDNIRYYNNCTADLIVFQSSQAVVTNSISTGLRGGNTTGTNGPDDSFLANADYVNYGSHAQSMSVNAVDGAIMENLSVTNIRSLAEFFGIYATNQVQGLVIRKCNVTDASTVLADLTPLGPDYAAGLYGYESRGIAAEVGSVGILIEDCTVQNIGCTLQNVYNFGFIFSTPNSVAAYSLHTDIGMVVRNCSASDIWSSGKITALQPGTGTNQLVGDMRAVGFFREIESELSPGHNAVFEDCSATNINGGLGVPLDMASPAYGFTVNNVNFLISPDVTPLAMMQVFRSCSTQDVFGNNESGGFVINYRPPFAGNGHAPFPVIFEDCTAQFDRINNPTGLSNGFITGASRGNNTVFRNCTATGHTLNGFDLAGYLVDSPVGNAGFILENCIANGNTKSGFRLHHTLKQVEVIDCKSTNNGDDGFKASGRDLIFRSCIADLNLHNGFSFHAYFSFYAKVATDTDLANLNIYGGPGSYTVQYYPASPDTPGFAQYLQLIPNDLSQPIPSVLIINKVVVMNGDIILVKDEINGVLDGVYQVNNIGGVPNGNTSTPVWQLVRVDPWRFNNTIPADTKILVAESNTPNLKPGPVMYILRNDTTVDVTVPKFEATKCIKPAKSEIILDSCKASLNGNDGLYNGARSVTVSGNNCSQNKGNGFVDNSIGGAERNGNLYIRNGAYLNNKDNYVIDYVTQANPSVLQIGSISPAIFPTKDAPEANISIVKKAKYCKK